MTKRATRMLTGDWVTRSIRRRGLSFWYTQQERVERYRDTIVGCSFTIAVCICFMYKWGADQISRHQLIWV
jgi:hypothetical protein